MRYQASWRYGLAALMWISFLATLSVADEPTKTVLLWEAGAPGKLGDEAKDKPQAILYLLEGATPSPLLVICPGGGYGGLAMDHEGHQIAKWANGLGMSALICDYRHRNKGYGHPCPLEDAQRAIRLARHSAADWKIDAKRVGIIGFSAGGHLASTVLTHFDHPSPVDDAIGREDARPDFGILCYPVIGFDKPYTHRGSQVNLLGEKAAPELIASLSNETQVTSKTPPTFLFHTEEDTAVPPENSLTFYASLVAKKVPSEIHVFPKGRHGIGLGKGVPGAEQWPGLCKVWLEGLGMTGSP